jgi:hypothetical protein
LRLLEALVLATIVTAAMFANILGSNACAVDKGRTRKIFDQRDVDQVQANTHEIRVRDCSGMTPVKT